MTQPGYYDIPESRDVMPRAENPNTAPKPMSWNQLVATVQFFLDSFVGQIALAFGAIDIFGWKPLEFLAEWGQARIDEASENYALATGANNRSLQIVSDTQRAWAGEDPEPEATAVYDTIVAIKDAVINGYTVETITSDESWPGPTGPITELTVIAVASGEDGQDGQFVFANAGEGTAAGGTRGRNGSYVVQTLNPADVTYPVAVSIGVNGGSTSFGPYLSVSPGAAGGIATPFGYTETLSLPGNGGNGGNAVTGTSAGNGGSGGSSAVAGGGSGGAGSAGVGTGNPGAAGNDANPAATTKCGGGGGGGGGGRYATGFLAGCTGGDGGDGGYPGGGGGGGGGAAVPPTGSSAVGGLGGLGAPGIVWIYYR